LSETLRTWWLLRELRRERRLPPEARADRQSALLRAAVRHAYERVPFYRHHWEAAGLHPDAVRGLEDLPRLPPVPYELARAALVRGELVTDGADPASLPAFPTSGTSGERAWVPRGPAEQRRWRAGALRIWLEHGYRWSDVTVQLDPNPGPPHPLQHLGLSRTRWLSTGLPLAEQMRELAAARADVLVGTPTVLRRLASATARPRTEAVRPRIVFCHGEVLDAGTSARLADAFGVAPVGLYGLTEIGYAGWQCERRGAYHVNSGTCLVEVMCDGGPARAGGLGEVVVTDLRGRTAPLLRCATGDLAVAADGPCECGRPFALLGSLEGRARDLVELPGGRRLTGRAIVDHMADLLEPERYRLRQEEPTRFRLELDGAPAADAVRHLRRLLGDVEVEAVAGRPANGRPDKSRPVTSALTAARS
jgi:phenylacetate-CoA ligase